MRTHPAPANARTALAALAVALAAAPPAARAGDEGLPAETLKDLKAATVFIKVQFHGPGGRPLPATGSGFLLLVEGTTGYVVTNHHVVEPPRPGFRREGDPTLVFWSGTRKERSATAEVLASDPSRDLALLRVAGFDGLPKPLRLDQKIALVETLPVYVLGFPFGEALSGGKGNPAITVGKGSVSSLRENEAGEIAVVQIDGDLNPGNSGGPVVDRKGRLVGVAVAKVRATRIGMAVPPLELARLLEGRVGGLSLKGTPAKKGGAELRAEARLIDPLKKIKSVSVLVLPAPAERPRPGPDGRWAALPGARRVPLKVDGATASATFAAAGTPGDGKLTYLVQTSYETGDGRVLYTEPGTFTVEIGRPVAEAGPVGGVEAEVKRGGEDLSEGARAVGNLSVQALKLPGGAKGVPGCMCWSPDGKAFYFLQGDEGVLRRVAVNGLREEMRLDVRKRCTWLSPSGEGLLLTVADVQEVWVLDPDTLKVKRRLEAPSVQRCVSAPGLSVAVAVNAGDDARVFDLKPGGTSRDFHTRSFGKNVNYRFPTLTPDGKYLFTMGGTEQLIRFRVEGTGLALDEMSPRIAQNGQGIAVSPDGKYVCLPSGGGNYQGLPNHPEVRPYSTYVYAVDNLRKPAFTLHQGNYPRAVAFDPKAGAIYAQNFENQLVLFSPTGVRRQEHPLSERGDEVKQFLVHPEGGRLIVLTERRVFYVATPRP
jgi:S1-C subfamily serine protease